MTRAALIAAFLVVVVAWLGADTLRAQAQTERKTWPDLEGYVLLPAPTAARFVTLGYRELAADVFWARTLVYYGASRAGESDFRYLEQLLDTVITLDPMFGKAYRWAAYSVTYKQEKPTPDEFRTSVKYLEKAMERFPDDYEYFWLAGLRYYFDLAPSDKDLRRQYRERGATLIEQAIRKPNAPRDLASLAAGMRYELGQHERALQELKELILTTEDEKAKNSMLKKYEALAQSPEAGAALRSARERFTQEWRKEMPFAPATMYVLLGNRPETSIDFVRLAADRDLFGTGLDADEGVSDAPDDEADDEGDDEMRRPD